MQYCTRGEGASVVAVLAKKYEYERSAYVQYAAYKLGVIS